MSWLLFIAHSAVDREESTIQLSLPTNTRTEKKENLTSVIYRSRVCAVAQYAVLEANGKVNGIGEISDPSPSQTLGPIWMPLQIYHYVRPGS